MSDEETARVVLFIVSAFFTTFGLLIAPRIGAPWYVHYGAFGVALAVAAASLELGSDGE